MNLSIDFANVLTQAETIINSMWPVFAVPLGLVLGFALLDKILKSVKGAFSGSRG